jgi:hypothetical protein
MVGLLYVVCFYLRKLKPRFRGQRPSHPEMRRWRRYPVDLPVRVNVPNRDGATRVFTLARGTAVSGGGMALYVDLPLKREDAIEVEFQTPSKLLVTGIVRNQTNHCFGLEFLTPL